MTAGVGVQPRRTRGRPAARRRSGGGGRLGGEAAPRLFPDGADATPPGPAAPDGALTPASPPAPDGAPSGGRREEATLEQLICGLWDEVLSEGRAACPLCGGEMVGRASAHARVTEGRCGDCGTTIG